MKRITLIMIMILALLSPAFAQKSGKSKEEMRKELHEFRVKYIAQEIALEPSKQKQFVEEYNRRHDERHAVMHEKRALEKKLKQSANATDEEYAAVTRGIQQANEKLVAIDRKYDERFAKFLTQKQIFKMHEAEEQFRAKMREMRKKR